MAIEIIEYAGTKYAEVIRATERVSKTTFFSPAESSFQFGLLAHEKGFIEPPHYHAPMTRTIADLQQMFVVQRGIVAVSLYDDAGALLREIVLHAGDAIVLIHGVHAIRVIEDMQCISVKQGPFLGTEKDKVIVEVKKPVIPVFQPEITDADIAAVTTALRRGEISGSFGEALYQFESEFARYCGCKHGVAVSSGTTALHLAVATAGIGDGDEILVSSSTNVATALAAYHNRAVPVPVDSEELTWNLDLDLVEGLITPRTRAIIPVHLFGHPVDMDRLGAIARKHGLTVIEDCAESHGATVRGRMTGSFGEMGCFSFYANKVITTGEGGMITTNDDRLAEKLRLLRNLAFTTPRFRHEEAGYNFRMTGYQGALGLSQLQRIEQTIAGKRRVAHAYQRQLEGIRGLRLPVELEWARNVYWMYAVVVEPAFGISRDALMVRLREAGIETRTFFCGMNQQPFLRSQPGYREVACPVADRLWSSGLYLPSAATLDEGTIARIAEAVRRAPAR